MALGLSLPVQAEPLTPASRSRDPDTLIINVAGDIAYPNGWGGIDYIDEKKHELFALVQPILDTADVNFANIECPLTDVQAVVEKEFPIACKQMRLDYITSAGFNLLSLANNHSVDAGLTGIKDTIALLLQKRTDGKPLWWAGTGETADDAKKPVIFAPPGKNTRIAFFAVANTSPKSTVASIHDPTLLERIARARASADIVVVSIHYGPEYVHVPSKDTVDKYHRLIDAGADLVVAHHAHVVQGVERYKQGFIFYNLGNFSFGSRTRRHLVTGARMYSMIGRIFFHKGKLQRVELVPLYANNSARWTLGEETLEPRHATPQLLRGGFAQAALDEFEEFTRSIPGTSATPLVRVGDRAFIECGGSEPEARDIAERLHQQRHEYAVVHQAGAAPRPATEAEKQVKGRAGTPDAAVREAQRQAELEAKQPAKKKGQKQRSRKGKRR